MATRSWLLSGDFGRFWLGQTISNLGSSFTFFALPLLVFKLTGSPINLGITTAAEFVPYLLFGLVIGAWVRPGGPQAPDDRHRPGAGGRDRHHPLAGRRGHTHGGLGVWVQASYSAAQIAGPLLAGLLITVAPIQQVLWVDAASFLVSAGTLVVISTAFNAARP
jgi:hypothetical protein